ncbi:MAG: hypothetical protein A4E48_01024 [Methanosaeta sp. PtaU1.Bin060]|nr:MAG: hypothetical protein A4E48_01024 [Methanosaeta sp. PtaU1.Bin060]
MQSLGAIIAGLVDRHGLGQLLLNGCGICVDGDLHLLDEWHLRLVQIDDGPEYLGPGGYALLLEALACPHPDVVPLVEMHEAADIGEQGVVAPLDDGLEILLDLLAADLEDHAEGNRGSFRGILQVRSYDCDLSILYLVHGGGKGQLKAICLGAAHLYP